MRVHGMILRRALEPVHLNGWTVPKDALVAAVSNFGGYNENVWNTGTPESPHPLDTFWPERFLKYSDNPESGPSRVQHPSMEPKSKEYVDSPSVTYSEDGLRGAFFPFGGGLHPCPGRQFATHEALNTLAILVLRYDVKICVKDGWTPRMKTEYFGIGTLPPRDKVPFQIRRKHAS